MKTLTIAIVVSIILLGAFYALMEEDPCAGHRGRIITRSFFSPSVDDTYKIVIFLPEDYEKNVSLRYPVIYQLDGNYQGKLTAILASHYSCKGVIPTPAIVVGIGYKYKGWDYRRVRDMTYPPPRKLNPYLDSQRAGGGMKFYRFIKDELIPYVDSHFRTDNRTYGRTLSGHAVGGYFALFVMFHQFLDTPDSGSSPLPVFTNFIAASPFLAYNHEYLFDREKQMAFSRLKSLPVSLYMSMSDREERTDSQFFSQFSQRVKTWKFPGFRVKCTWLEKLLHHETVIPSYKEGLKFVFEEKPRMNADKHG
jgi:predicted alpha/beta superfamily hydrolase